MNTQPTQPSATPRTDAAYFASGATMYSIAGEMNLVERELTAAQSMQSLACRKLDEAEKQLAAAREECERLRAMGSWAHTCVHHTDADRKAGVSCPCCASAELARLRAEVERLEMCNSELHGIIDNAGYPSGVDYDREKARAERAEAQLAERQWLKECAIKRTVEVANERDALAKELQNIANAKPHEWGDESDQFQPWAQNRARHALNSVINHKTT